MSEHDKHDEHSSFIKTPKQLLAIVVLAFLVPIFIISLLASLASRSVEPSATAFSEEAIARRLKPVGEVVVAAAGGAANVRSGQQVVEAVCAACHATGALNAPKIGDTVAWQALIKEGQQHLTENAIKGIRQMPPRGGNPELSDVEVARAVVYMANQAGAKFAEPAAPATPAIVQAAAPGAAQAGASAAAPAAATGAAASAPAGGAAGDASKGKSVYDASCAACHTAGVAGAPKFGDKAAWAPRIKEGMPHLYETALKGKGAMPPKGGTSAPDADVKAAVDYMVNAAK
jgi:cytochrome c5